MSQRVTIVLCAMLAVAGWFLWQDLTGNPNLADLAPADRVKRILTFDIGRVDDIEIREGSQVARFRRSGGVWSGTHDPARVDSLLETLRDLAEILALDSSARILADLGLAPPRVSISLRSEGRSLAELRVGNRNPAATGVYLQVGEGGPIVLTGALLEWEIEKLFPRGANKPTDVGLPPGAPGI